MFEVRTIWREAKKIVGVSDDTFVYQRITDAIEILANKGDWDPLIGALDIPTNGSELVALPAIVETPLALSMCGMPALARDQLFRFHLNGLGNRRNQMQWSWEDQGQSCTYRELPCASKLIGFCNESEDEGCELWIYGHDQNGNILRTKVGDTWVNGVKIPVSVSSQTTPPDAPVISRITRVRKAVTAGPVRLSTIDNDTCNGVLLGIYQWNETEPAFRRIRLSKCVPCIRIVYRRTPLVISSQDDLIPLGNSQAVVMMLRALRNYDAPGGLSEAEGQESTAMRWLSEEQHTSAPAVVAPIQVHNDGDGLNDKTDYVD